MKSNCPFWAKYQEVSKAINLDGLFNDYQSSDNHEFTVLGQLLSPTSLCTSDREAQSLLSLESTVALSNYDSLKMIPFVSLPLPIFLPAANVHAGRSFLLITPRTQGIARGTLPIDKWI